MVLPYCIFSQSISISPYGVARAANTASFALAPIGMVVSGVAVASYAAQGNWNAVAISAAGFIPGGKIASSIALRSTKGTKVIKAVMS